MFSVNPLLSNRQLSTNNWLMKWKHLAFTSFVLGYNVVKAFLKVWECTGIKKIQQDDLCLKKKRNDILERLPVKWSWQHVMWSKMFGLDAAWTKFWCLVANRMKLLMVVEWLQKRRSRNPTCWSRTRSTGRWSIGQFLPLFHPTTSVGICKVSGASTPSLQRFDSLEQKWKRLLSSSFSDELLYSVIRWLVDINYVGRRYMPAFLI